MKTQYILRTMMAAGLALGLAGGALAAGEHSHGAANTVALKLDHGKKWAVDEPARHAMGEIRNAMAGALDAIHHDKYSAADYKALGGKVEEAVHYMVSNCKLPPEVDEQLHVVLEQVMEGADAMKGGKHAQDGAVKVVKALDAYGKHFEHAGWKPLEH